MSEYSFDKKITLKRHMNKNMSFIIGINVVNNLKHQWYFYHTKQNVQKGARKMIYIDISVVSVAKQRTKLEQHKYKSHCKKNIKSPSLKLAILRNLKYVELKLKVRKTWIISLPKGMKTDFIPLLWNMHRINLLSRNSVIVDN